VVNMAALAAVDAQDRATAQMKPNPTRKSKG
jgi:hypothetical protein